MKQKNGFSGELSMALSPAEGLWAFGGILAASKEEALKKTTKANHPLTVKDNEHLR